nr:AAC_HP1_G0006740.mRNA.1.CDS.1 [Saccharomyces cerevisiae]
MISSCVTRCFGRGKCLPGPATASIYQTIRCISTNSNKAAEAPIFPKLEDVKMHELIGNNNFGKKTYYVEKAGPEIYRCIPLIKMEVTRLSRRSERLKEM